jgi:hypothetical protein
VNLISVINLFLLLKIPMKGFKNFNNTCFIDSIMQALFHLHPFIKFLLQFHLKTPLIEETTHLYLLISDSYSNKSNIDNATINFLKECKKNNFLSELESINHGYQQQQDCCEFMEAYLNNINKEIFEIANPNEDYVSKLTFTLNPNKTEFHQLYNLNIIEQKNCCNNHSSETPRDESFIQLSLPIMPFKCDFNKLLKAYFQKTKIENSYCTSKLNGQDCNKTMHSRFRLVYPPQILIIQLKRYYFKYYSKKNRVDITIEFDLQTDCFNGEIVTYELFSIVCHSGGDSLNFGHYTCFSKEKDNNWYLFDDLNVVRFADLSTTDSVDYRKCSSDSYVLFYVRKTLPSESFSFEKQFSQLTVSQSSSKKDEQIIFEHNKKNDEIDNSNNNNVEITSPFNFIVSLILISNL